MSMTENIKKVKPIIVKTPSTRFFTFLCSAFNPATADNMTMNTTQGIRINSIGIVKTWKFVMNSKITINLKLSISSFLKNAFSFLASFKFITMTKPEPINQNTASLTKVKSQSPILLSSRRIPDV